MVEKKADYQTESQKKAQEHIDTEHAAYSGETGSARVIFTKKSEKDKASIHKLPNSFKQRPKSMTKAQKAFKSIYEAEGGDCPENFIMQVAFTSQNSFLLTTDGRVFSWGGYTPCLGNIDDEKKNNTSKEEEKNNTLKEDRELEIIHIANKNGGRAIIQAIATGRSHVLALDIEGNVYSWGRNLNGQLGVGERENDQSYPYKNGQNAEDNKSQDNNLD